MNYTIEPSIFEDYWVFSLSRTYGVCAETLLYGVLLVLLSMVAYLFFHRTGAGRKGSTYALLFWQWSASVLQLKGTWGATNVARLYLDFYNLGDLFLVTNNAVTDSLFIYRCYIVWGGILGYISACEYDYIFPKSYVDYRISFGELNCPSLCGPLEGMWNYLTAGRVWWIRRDAALVLGAACVRRYNTVIAIILESGALYCFSIVLFMVFTSLSSEDSVIPTALFRGAMAQIMNIAPALTIVPVGFGYGAKDGESDNALPRPRRIGRRNTLISDAEATVVSFVLDIRAAEVGCTDRVTELKEVN
ncbi:hypothetical protein B0H16DRAFT_1737442 [Mycena metata]|uniref:Uncharacterized protein n=1 Tax=Mycena metata TaxID=1033252 RepID=A0AAD7HLK1_9AGAR|nr:hypothetical protein B0H16DRAFT_1737442 [Mycena metata]